MSAPPPDYPDYPDYPPFGYGPPAYPPQGYGPPPNYGPYPPYPSYPSSPSYGGYPPYPPSSYSPAPAAFPRGAPSLRPGIIPLRPLGLGDIFNGAAAYIRTNVKATLGLTAIVVISTQIITLAATVGPLAAASRLKTTPADEVTGGDVAAWTLSAGVAGVVNWLAGVLLGGMLAVVVGRAVFGATIGPGETWVKIRGRLPALLGLVALECVGLILLAGLVGLIIGAVAAANAAAAVVIGFPLLLVSAATVVYFYTMLSFAPVLIVLERLPVFDAIARSLALVRNSFWRVLGIRLLTAVVVLLVANAVAAPFNFVGPLLFGSMGSLLLGATVGAVGSAIGRIITTPFVAGVVTLLYTDRRIRAEAFDLVLQTGAAGGPAQWRPATATDYFWLTRPV